MRGAFSGVFACSSSLLVLIVGIADGASAVPSPPLLEIISAPELFAPGTVSTAASEVRLTLSPDGQTAAWFSRNRPGGAGEYDIWISKRDSTGWAAATPASFNSPHRDFDPAFSADGRFIYFCSNRPGGLGGDDIYRVPVLENAFGVVEHLGANVNSTRDDWAPMLSPDNNTLLFSSNGNGAHRLDLFSARRLPDNSFVRAAALPGAINTGADEFDATFLADNLTVVFSRAPDINVDRITLAYASLSNEGYGFGTVLPPSVNAAGQNTYGPMLDWSRPDRLTISSQRPEARAGSTDLYVLRYRLTRPPAAAR